MKSKLFLSVLIIIACVSISSGQKSKRVNVWYFGTNAGLDFNSGSPVNLTNGMLNTYEGVASICDTSGSLLFYTDGSTVYDRTHTVMANGTGLMGASSSSQSAIIVPEPLSDSLYYLFAVKDGGSGGLTYSKIDMSLNAGFGDVMAGFKNIPLVTPTAEKLTACMAQNGTDVWVIVHEWNSDNFYAYLVTPSGVNPPVISATGSVHATTPNQIGCMKTNHNGTKLAVAITYISTAEIFDFDRATGVISNPLSIANLEDPYGVEFSPDNSKLYFSSRAPYTTKSIYQFDMNAGSPAAIAASKAYVDFSATISANNGSMQLAPDGKIYIAHDNSNWLEIIADPNQPAATCGYSLNGFDLSPRQSQQGLPNYVTTFFTSVNFYNTCFGDSTQFEISTSGLVAAAWNFDDPASGADSVAYVFNPVHVFSAPGTYSVQLIYYYLNGSSDTIYTDVTIANAPQINLGVDTTFCTGSTMTLNAGGGYANYLWHDGSTDSLFTVSATGTFYVTVNESGCVGSDTINLTEIPCAPSINLSSSDTTFCEKQCIDFYDLSTNNPITWQWFFTGASPDTSTLQNPTNICYNNYGSFDVILIACSALGCDTLVLTNFIQEFQNPTDSITFDGVTLTSQPFMTYQWYEVSTGIITGATSQTYVPTGPGSYYCLVTDSIGCVATSNNIVITGLNQLSIINSQLSIIPNPNNGAFQISLVNDNERINAIKIYDAAGKIVFNQNGLNNSISANLNLKLNDGVYFIEIETSGKTLHQRFMIRN